MLTNSLQMGPIQLGHEDFFLISRGLSEDFALRACNEGVPPEFNAIATVWARFVADTIGRTHIEAIADCMPLHGPHPGIELSLPILLLFRW